VRKMERRGNLLFLYFCCLLLMGPFHLHQKATMLSGRAQNITSVQKSVKASLLYFLLSIHDKKTMLVFWLCILLCLPPYKTSPLSNPLKDVGSSICSSANASKVKTDLLKSLIHGCTSQSYQSHQGNLK